MRHAHDNDMQTNICNAFCMLSGAWRYNDAILSMFHNGDASANPTCCVYFLLDLQFLKTY